MITSPLMQILKLCLVNPLDWLLECNEQYNKHIRKKCQFQHLQICHLAKIKAIAKVFHKIYIYIISYYMRIRIIRDLTTTHSYHLRNASWGEM